METLRDQIKDSRAHKSADMPEKMMFLVRKGINMRGFEENSLYIDI